MESDISIYQLRKIVIEVAELEQIRDTEKQEFREKMLDIDKRLTDIRNKCPHPLTKYYPDASGNNDSTTECLICGKTAKHLTD